MPVGSEVECLYEPEVQGTGFFQGNTPTEQPETQQINQQNDRKKHSKTEMRQGEEEIQQGEVMKKI